MSFTFDLTAGMTDEAVRERYQKLVRAVGRLENTVMFLVASHPERADEIPEPYRQQVKNLLAAYED